MICGRKKCNSLGGDLTGSITRYNQLIAMRRIEWSYDLRESLRKNGFFRLRNDDQSDLKGSTLLDSPIEGLKPVLLQGSRSSK